MTTRHLGNESERRSGLDGQWNLIVNSSEVVMRDSRFRKSNRDFALVILVLVTFALAGCVSVQKTGEKTPQPPPATTGVSFSSQPGNAEVWIDGEFRGTAPVTLHLAAGKHEIVFRLDGHRPWSRELVVVAGDDTRVTAKLQPE